ncbi:MAG: DUF4352 domain-containing protein [Nanoarchaeota archaeon]
MKLKKIFGLFLVLILVFMAGCSSDRVYQQPEKVETSNQEIDSEVSLDVKEKIDEEPSIQTFKVGETATDNQIQVTLNEVRFVDIIDEQNNEFMVSKAANGKDILIIDLTVENILSDKTQSFSSILQLELMDEEGYTYDLDFMASTNLERKIGEGDILPGKKKRGQIAYEVPEEVNKFELMYSFDVFSDSIAVFIIER